MDYIKMKANCLRNRRKTFQTIELEIKKHVGEKKKKISKPL